MLLQNQIILFMAKVIVFLNMENTYLHIFILRMRTSQLQTLPQKCNLYFLSKKFIILNCSSIDQF